MYQFYKLKSALSGIINQGFPKAFSSSLYGVILTSKKLMEIRNRLKFMTQNHMKNGGWFNPLRNYKLLPGILQKTAKTKKNPSTLQNSIWQFLFENSWKYWNCERSELRLFKKKIREYFFWIFAPKIKQKLQKKSLKKMKINWEKREKMELKKKKKKK